MHATQFFVALAATVVGTASASDICNNYLASCSDVQLVFLGDNASEPWLHANGGCGDNKGGRTYGFFDLNTKFSNSFGNIVRKDEGGFAHSCKNVRYENGVLTAECGDGNGGTPTSSIDLNKYICNNGGRLECF